MIKGFVVAVAEGVASAVGTVGGAVVGGAVGVAAGAVIGYQLCEKAAGDAVRSKLGMTEPEVIEAEVIIEPEPVPKTRARKAKPA